MKAVLSLKNIAIHEIANNLNISLYFNRDKLPKIDKLIRWGSTKQLDARVVWNPSKAIYKAANKKLCRQILTESGIPVPLNGEDLFPCIGRPNKHSRGRKFIVCRSTQDVLRAKRLGCEYFSQFYPKQREYRVHVGSGKILFMQEKIGGDHKFVWNHDKGYVFDVLGRGEWRPEVYRPAKAAIKALGLDFGAVDIGTDARDLHYPRAVVFEVNTCPALSDYGIRKYTEYFEKELNLY